MDMLPSWKERSIITANILNPAFCGEVLRISIQSYSKKTKSSFPFPLAFVILPLVLHKKTRNKFPKTTKTSFLVWLESNDEIKVNMAETIKNMVPFTREAILFLIYNDAAHLDEKGNFTIPKYRKKRAVEYEANEVNAIYKKAEFFGKWISNVGGVYSVFAFLGIKP
jgi:hypothetical protein